MLPGPDWLVSLYGGCFLFGLIFTGISAVFSFAHWPAGHQPHAHLPYTHLPHAHVTLGHSHTVGGHSSHVPGSLGTSSDQTGMTGGPPLPPPPVDDGPEDEHPGWLNMPTLLAGITWFGGAGTVLTNSTLLPWTMVLGLAVGAGVLGGYIVYFFFARLLWPAQTPPMSRDEYDLRGTYARVVSGIALGGVGEIMYVKGGTRAVAGARSADGSVLPKGSEVVVVRYERGLADVLARSALNGTDPSDAGRITTELPANPALPLPSRPGDAAATPTRNL